MPLLALRFARCALLPLRSSRCCGCRRAFGRHRSSASTGSAAFALPPRRILLAAATAYTAVRIRPFPAPAAGPAARPSCFNIAGVGLRQPALGPKSQSACRSSASSATAL
jgi:hypothetical protein